MVIESNYQRVLDLFIENNDNKPIDFFAVLKMDEFINKWFVLLGAQWVTEENGKEAFNSLTSILVDAKC
jgi:hypothetical protein